MKEREHKSVEQAMFQNIRAGAEVAAAGAKPLAKGVGEVLIFMAANSLRKTKMYQRVVRAIS